MKDKAIVVETEDGILFKPLPSPNSELGSLSTLLSDKTVKELMTEARAHEKAE